MIRLKQRDPGAEALQDPMTTIIPGEPAGKVEFATTEVASDGSVTVNVSIVGCNILGSAGVDISYGEDGAINARQLPFSGGGSIMEFNIASDGTLLPAIYHGKYGAELIG